MAKGLAAMVQQGPARRSASHAGARRHRAPRLVDEPGTPQWPRRPSGPRRPASVPDFHRLRIRCKRLRYALEFGSEVYDGRTSRYRPPADGAPGRARPACRTPRWPACNLAELATGESSSAGGDCLRDGRRGGAPPPRRRPLLAATAQRAGTGQRARMARPPRADGEAARPRPRRPVPRPGTRCGPCRRRRHQPNDRGLASPEGPQPTSRPPSIPSGRPPAAPATPRPRPDTLREAYPGPARRPAAVAPPPSSRGGMSRRRRP